MEIPLVVLINQGTAGAAEVAAAALQETRRATLVGVRTYGTGRPKNAPLPVSEGPVIGEWLTSLKRPFDGIGIQPDIVIAQTALLKKDVQLRKAVEVLLQAR
jgi:carboxyl-terminal processing protease